VNDPEQVQADFQDYYGGNYMEEVDQTDPNSIYLVKGFVGHAYSFEGSGNRLLFFSTTDFLPDNLPDGLPELFRFKRK